MGYRCSGAELGTLLGSQMRDDASLPFCFASELVLAGFESVKYRNRRFIVL
jgi:hypothetical protein